MCANEPIDDDGGDDAPDTAPVYGEDANWLHQDDSGR
jgi:hypothetical protein